MILTGMAGSTRAMVSLPVFIVPPRMTVCREPIDALKQVVTQSWSYIGGFVVPTDVTANPNTIPTASNAAYKRAVIVESL